MTKYILIGGYIHKAQDGGKAFCEEVAKSFSHKQPIKILDCLFARDRQDWNERFENDRDFFLKHSENFQIELADSESFLEQVKASDGIFFQGGSPRQLMNLLMGVGDWASELDGQVVIGSSGGADTLCKYYAVGKTGNIGEGLGLLSIKIFPHWKSESDYAEGLQIDWEKIEDNLKSHNEPLETFCIKEGEFIVLE